MARNENFFGRLRELVEESRDALGPTGTVKDPLEYRFEVYLGDRRFAFQGLPAEGKVLVGEEAGDRGVAWFEELLYDEASSGWGTVRESAWDFVAGLSDLPAMTASSAEATRAEGQEGKGLPGGRGVRAMTLVLEGAAVAGATWLTVRSFAQAGRTPRLFSRLRRRSDPRMSSSP